MYSLHPVEIQDLEKGLVTTSQGYQIEVVN